MKTKSEIIFKCVYDWSGSDQSISFKEMLVEALKEYNNQYSELPLEFIYEKEYQDAVSTINRLENELEYLENSYDMVRKHFGEI